MKWLKYFHHAFPRQDWNERNWWVFNSNNFEQSAFDIFTQKIQNGDVPLAQYYLENYVH